jgi:hypothetical protein
MAGCEFADARLEGLLRYVADLQTKASENAAEAQRDVRELFLELLACDQQGTNLLRPTDLA